MYIYTPPPSNSEKPFIPTWLYIKQHAKTGLKYFGKTTRDPLTYHGSGTRWVNHCKAHGTDIITLWSHRYTDRAEIIEEATAFSRAHNIVDSAEWANLKPEDGINGGSISTGLPRDKEWIRKAGEGNRGKTRRRPANPSKQLGVKRGPMTDDVKQKISISNKGKTFSESHKKNLSESLKGREISAESIAKGAQSRTGQTRTEETKKKMSNAKLGKALSDDHKMACSKAHKGIPWSAARRAAQENRQKK